MNWREYWNGPHSIYANERHRTLHFDLIARDIARLIPSRDAIVLDYGCGEADTAEALAAKCGKLYLFDTADTVRARLAAKHANNPKIVVLDEAGLEDVPDQSIDLIVVNSVLQYLSHAELVTISTSRATSSRATERWRWATSFPMTLTPSPTRRRCCPSRSTAGFSPPLSQVW